MYALDGMMGGWDWVLGSVMMLLVWGTTIWGGLYFWRRSGRQGPTRPEAAEILQNRFARSEMDRIEFEERLAELRRGERR